MGGWLADPWVQSAVAPLAAGLAVAALGIPLRLSGLATAAGFLAAVYLSGNLSFEPLNLMRRLILVGAIVAPLLGAMADVAFRPTRVAGIVLGALFGLAALWIFSSALGPRPTLAAAPIVLLVIWITAWMMTLDNDAVRAGAGGLGLGAGVAAAAMLGGAPLAGKFAVALAAACGGFLLLTMLLGHRVIAGTSLTLTAGVLGSLLACAALLLGNLPWYSAVALALVPIAARFPLPERAGAFAQVLAATLYVSIVAAAAGAFTWLANQR